MISTISMIIIIIIIISNSGIIFSFYGFVKLLLMQSLHSCFPRAATVCMVYYCFKVVFFMVLDINNNHDHNGTDI